MNPKKLGFGVTWLGHATVLYRTEGGKTILVDPWVDHNPACPEPMKKLPPLDLVLVTHGHGDHFQDCIDVLRRANPDVVCIYEISLYLGSKGFTKLHGINKGGSVTLHGVRVTMVQAVHSSSIVEDDRLIPAGEPCGYVIEFENGVRLYHAGDTAVFGDMKLIGELYRPSIAALPIGDLFTMSPLEAAAAAKLLGVGSVIPIHHSTFPALTGTPQSLRDHLKGTSIEVVELKPGESA